MPRRRASRFAAGTPATVEVPVAATLHLSADEAPLGQPARCVARTVAVRRRHEPGDVRQLLPGGATTRGAATPARSAAGRVRGARAVPRAGGSAALLQGNRYRDGRVPGRRAP